MKSNKILLITVFLLFSYLIIRFIDHGHLLFQFPFDFTNDLSSHIAKVVFLSEYGFHHIVPYWYNGYELFKFYPPAWFYFTLPIYELIGNSQISTYLSLGLIYVIGLVFFLILGKMHKFSKLESIFYFLFFLASPIAIGNFIKLGRLPELFGWLMFIPFAGLILWYKDNKIDKKIWLLVIVYSIMLLSHQTTFIIASVLLICLFLVKNYKERIILIGASIITAVLTSFWWYPFIRDIKQSSILEPTFSNRLFLWEGLLAENILSLLIPLAFIFMFYFYWKSLKKSKKELIFFFPLLIIAVLFLFRLIAFIPGLNILYPDVYHHFFIFMILYLYLKTNFPLRLSKIFHVAIVPISIIMILASIFMTPWFVENSQLDEDIISLLPAVEGKFVMYGITESYGKAYYSYAPVYYNLSTPAGWSHNEKSTEYLESFKEMGKAFREGSCEELKLKMKELDTKTIITSDEFCVNSCELDKTKEKGRACLLVIN